MKKLSVILFVFTLHFSTANCQPCSNYCLGFDFQYCMDLFSIDTNVQNNIWQIGPPQKSVFSSAQTGYNAIVTDTLNTYPVNNISTFTVTNSAGYGDVYGISIFNGNYYVNSDSLNDYGTIEMSFDIGNTWINIVDDTTYNCFYWLQKPVLTGNSNTWKYFEAYFYELGSVFNIEYGDTVMFRFSFFSDSIYDNRDGLMYDNICFGEFIEGISETHFTPVRSSAFPVPSDNFVTISVENPSNAAFEISIYTVKSVPVLKIENLTEDEYKIDVSRFTPGTYMYKLTNYTDKKRSWGKFVMQ